MYRAVRRPIKAFLLKSAYVKEEEFSLPSGEIEEVPGREKTDSKGYIEESDERAAQREGVCGQFDGGLRLPLIRRKTRKIEGSLAFLNRM